MQNLIKTKGGQLVVLPTAAEDAVITAAALADPDAQPLTDADLASMRPVRGRPVLANKKMMLSLRVDPQVLTALRATGDGWQTRAAAVLKEAVENGRV